MNKYINIGDAADEFSLNTQTLARWCKEGVIKAERRGNGKRAPWVIDRTVLIDVLHEKGRIDPQKHPLLTPSLEPVCDSLTVQKTESATVHIETENPISQTLANTPLNVTKAQKYQPRPKPRVFPCKLSMQQLKDAIRSMTPKETRGMSDWLTMRLERKNRNYIQEQSHRPTKRLR
jgi:hypothetical protein